MQEYDTNFFHFHDRQTNVSRNTNNRVVWDVVRDERPFLYLTGAPFVAITVEASGQDAGWTLQATDDAPNANPSWYPVDSGTVSQGTRDVVYTDRIIAEAYALQLDSDGHDVRVYQTSVPIVSRLLADGGQSFVNEQLDTDIVASTKGMITYLARALGSIAQDVLRVQQKAKSIDTTLSLSNNTQDPLNVDPSANGADLPCSVKIQNVGQYKFWVGDSASTSGILLGPGERETFDNHTNQNGDIVLYPDSSNGLGASLIFRS